MFKEFNLEQIEEYINNQLGIIVILNEKQLNYIAKKNITINNEVLTPGKKTTLSDFFSGEVVYIGIYKERMLFQIGEANNLFESKIICNAFYKIDENRIVTVFIAGTAREFIYKNKKWV